MTSQSWQDHAWKQEIASSAGMQGANSVGELLARQAAAFGDRIALSMVEHEDTLTYRQLDDQVSKLASGLQKLGVAAQDRVAVCLPNRIEYPVTWLALARMGAVAVPVNTAYTPGETESILRDTGTRYLILDSSQDGPPGIPPNNIVWVGKSSLTEGHSWEQLVAAGDSFFTPEREVISDDLLTIQYTSGTTGMPKGCMQPHRFWLITGFTHPANQRDRPPFQSALGEAPFFYFDGLAMLMAMLTCGGTLYQADRYSSSKFFARVRATGAETAYLPRVWGEPDPFDRDHALKMFTGFGLTPEIVDEVESRFGATVREAYGMTEIGACMQVYLKDGNRAAIGTCGELSPTYEARIVDASGRNVETGGTGELWVRGPGVIDGYWNRPEANATTFVDGWFRTGDLFVQEDSGYYRITGRIKEMIKRSGENISAHEVEGVLMRYPGVAGVAVIPVPDSYRDEEVKAVLKVRPGVDMDAIDPADIRAFCELHLASFKCPRFISVVPDLPYIRDVKVDKMSLRNVDDPRAGCWDATIGAWIS